jgi:hypothetical protein
MRAVTTSWKLIAISAIVALAGCGDSGSPSGADVSGADDEKAAVVAMAKPNPLPGNRLGPPEILPAGAPGKDPARHAAGDAAAGASRAPGAAGFRRAGAMPVR